MKIFYKFIILFFFFIPGILFCDTETSKFNFSINSNKEQYFQYEPIYLELKLINNSDSNEVILKLSKQSLQFLIKKEKAKEWTSVNPIRFYSSYIRESSPRFFSNNLIIQAKNKIIQPYFLTFNWQAKEIKKHSLKNLIFKEPGKYKLKVIYTPQSYKEKAIDGKKRILNKSREMETLTSNVILFKIIANNINDNCLRELKKMGLNLSSLYTLQDIFETNNIKDNDSMLLHKYKRILKNYSQSFLASYIQYIYLEHLHNKIKNLGASYFVPQDEFSILETIVKNKNFIHQQDALYLLDTVRKRMVSIPTIYKKVELIRKYNIYNLRKINSIVFKYALLKTKYPSSIHELINKKYLSKQTFLYWVNPETLNIKPFKYAGEGVERKKFERKIILCAPEYVDRKILCAKESRIIELSKKEFNYETKKARWKNIAKERTTILTKNDLDKIFVKLKYLDIKIYQPETEKNKFSATPEEIRVLEKEVLKGLEE